VAKFTSAGVGLKAVLFPPEGTSTSDGISIYTLALGPSDTIYFSGGE
jgi:hypothetical protein